MILRCLKEKQPKHTGESTEKKKNLQDPKWEIIIKSLGLLPVPQHPRSQQGFLGVSKLQPIQPDLLLHVIVFPSRTAAGWSRAALQLPLKKKGAKRQGGHDPLLTRPDRRSDLRGGCWTPHGTGKARVQPNLPGKGERRGRGAHAATPTASSLSLARSPAPRGSPLPRGLRAHRSRPSPGRERAPATLRFFPPSPPGARRLTCKLPRRSRTPLPGGEQPTAQTSSSPGRRRCSSPGEGRQERGRGREGQGAGGDVTGGGAGAERPGPSFPSAPGTPDFRLGWGRGARFRAGEGRG